MLHFAKILSDLVNVFTDSDVSFLVLELETWKKTLRIWKEPLKSADILYGFNNPLIKY